MEASYTYTAELKWTGERKGELHVEGRPSIEIAPAPEFGGPPSVLSPEDLYTCAAVSSISTTFLAMADKVRASFVRFSCTAETTLEKVEGRGLVFTKLKLTPRVAIADHGEERAVVRALELAKKFCLVTNSMTCEVELEPEIIVV